MDNRYSTKVPQTRVSVGQPYLDFSEPIKKVYGISLLIFTYQRFVKVKLFQSKKIQTISRTYQKRFPRGYFDFSIKIMYRESRYMIPRPHQRRTRNVISTRI